MYRAIRLPEDSILGTWLWLGEESPIQATPNLQYVLRPCTTRASRSSACMPVNRVRSRPRHRACTSTRPGQLPVFGEAGASRSVHGRAPLRAHTCRELVAVGEHRQRCLAHKSYRHSDSTLHDAHPRSGRVVPLKPCSEFRGHNTELWCLATELWCLAAFGFGPAWLRAKRAAEALLRPCNQRRGAERAAVAAIMYCLPE
jgi:hypothetical protein